MGTLLREKFGFKIINHKTRVMESSRNVANCETDSRVETSKVGNVTSFWYLKSEMTQHGQCKKYINITHADWKSFLPDERNIMSNVDLKIRNRWLKTYIKNTAINSWKWQLPREIGVPSKRRLEAFQMCVIEIKES